MYVYNANNSRMNWLLMMMTVKNFLDEDKIKSKVTP